MLPEAFANFLSENVKKGMFMEMFTKIGEESQTNISLYDVMGLYL